MGFIKENYSNNRAGLIVAFGRGETSNSYYDGDSAEEAMKHFNLYLKDGEIYEKTNDEQALNNLGISAKEAVDFRKSVDSLLSSLTDEQASNMTILFPVWQEDVEYKSGDRVRYENQMYRVLQDHTAKSSWEPTVASSLFSAIITMPNVIMDWVQPDSTNGYNIGDKVVFEKVVYESLIDNNIWSPKDYPDGWKEIKE